jgi:copper(I)-binding protein
MQRRSLAAAAVAALIMAVLGPPGAARADEAGVTVTAPWMRLLIRARPAAGYFTLQNSGATPRELTGASSPGCGQLMLHRSMTMGGQDKMVMVDKVTVPAHGAVSFSPGGYHLMCMQPAATMQVGGSVPVTLHFADGGTLETAFPVKGAHGP